MEQPSDFQPPVSERDQQLREDRGEKQLSGNPDVIFKGAIWAGGNALITDYEQVVALFVEIEEGNLTVPLKLKQHVDSVTFNRVGDYQVSHQIDNMFMKIGRSSSIYRNLDEERPKDRFGWYHGTYELYPQALREHDEEWGEDPEAFGFFTQCAEFLALK